MHTNHSRQKGIGGLTATLLGCFLAVGVTAADIGKVAPAWELKDLDGKTVKSADFKGKVVVLNFWATWCPPCRKEIPSFVAMQNNLADQGFTIIGISLDQEGPRAVKKFAGSQKINYPVVMGDSKVTAAFGEIPSIPTTFIIDRQGKIVKKHVGLATQSEFEADVKPLLKAAAKS